MAEESTESDTELDLFKKELTTFLRESCDAMTNRAKNIPIRDNQTRLAAQELANTAMAYINLVALINAGCFDVRETSK
jgi:hypothetical protein